MSLRDLLDQYKNDWEFIYEKLALDVSYELKRLMDDKGITKKELAKKMGVNPSYVTKILSGENISLKTIAKVLAALEEGEVFLTFNKEKPTNKLGDIITKPDIFESLRKVEDEDSQVRNFVA